MRSRRISESGSRVGQGGEFGGSFKFEDREYEVPCGAFAVFRDCGRILTRPPPEAAGVLYAGGVSAISPG